MTIVSFESWSQCTGSVDAGDDVILCEPGEVTLNGSLNGDWLYFEWINGSGYQNGNDIQPTIFVDEDQTFTLTGHFFDPTAPNLIVNGDFESGNTGFNTQYTYVANPGPTAIWSEGTYTIASNPNAYHQNFDPCTDHTSGTGNMMIFNGSASQSIMWCQDINVNPNTYYIFDAWAASVENASPANLQFSINGGLIGSSFQLTTTTCLWQNFHAIWFSGTETNVEICIVNQNTQPSGNDFAIDDISFTESCKSIDEVEINVVEFEPTIEGETLINCYTPEVTLTAVVEPASANYTYNWSTFDGDFAQGGSDEEIIALSEGTYFVTVTDENDCVRYAEINVTSDLELPAPTLSASDTLDCSGEPITIFCNINNPSQFSYFWSGPANYSSEEQNIIIVDPGVYEVTVTNEDNGCFEIASIDIPVNDKLPVFEISSSGALSCSVTQITLSTTYNAPGASYAWTGQGLANNNSASVNVTSAGNYFLEITDLNGCASKKSITVTQLPSLLVPASPIQDTLSCKKDSIVLLPLISGHIDSIAWYYKQSFFTNVLQPIVTDTGMYIMAAWDVNGCETSDSIHIYQDKKVTLPELALIPINCVTNTGQLILQTFQNDYSYVVKDEDITITKKATFTEAGNYSILVTADNGCKDTLNFTIDKDQDFPLNTFTYNHINCEAKASEIYVSTSLDSVSYVWSGANGVIALTGNIQINEGGEYYLLTTSKKGCKTSDTISIFVDTIHPLIVLEIDTINCQKSFVIPEYEIKNSSRYALEWTGNTYYSQDSFPSFQKAGTYSLNVEADNGCEAVFTFDVTENFSRPQIDIETPPYLNCEVNNVVIEYELGDQTVFDSWIFNGIQNTHKNIIGFESGEYLLKAYHATSFCIDSFKVMVEELKAVPTLALSGADTITCLTTTITKNVFVLPIQSELFWHENQVILSQQNFAHFTQAGQYYIVAKHHESKCLDTLYFNIEADTIRPEFSVNATDITCKDSLSEIEITSDFLNLSLSFNSNQIQFNGSYHYTTIYPGNYNVEAMLPNGCETNVTFAIEANLERPEFTATSESLDCTGKAVPIKVSPLQGKEYAITLVGPNGKVHHDWEVQTSLEGSYLITLLDEVNGCTASQALVVPKVMDGPSAIHFGIPFSCEKQVPQFQLNQVVSGNPPFRFELNGIEVNEETLNQSYLEEGLYELKITDRKGCIVDTNFVIRPIEKVDVEIDALVSINYGAEVQLQIHVKEGQEQIQSIEWLPGSYLSCTDCLDPICKAAEDINYDIIITDVNGCTQDLETQIRVIYDVNIWYPNIIKAGDGINGQFTIFGSETVKEIDFLRIYDRWGNEVFQREKFSPNALELGWYGDINGREIVPGVYAFVTQVTGAKGEKLNFTGDVTVVR